MLSSYMQLFKPTGLLVGSWFHFWFWFWFDSWPVGYGKYELSRWFAVNDDQSCGKLIPGPTITVGFHPSRHEDFGFIDHLSSIS